MKLYENAASAAENDFGETEIFANETFSKFILGFEDDLPKDAGWFKITQQQLYERVPPEVW